MAELYHDDHYSWSLDQSRKLKEGRFSELDIEQLVEEVEDMGNRHIDAVESYLVVLLQHLLKWRYQPENRSGSWRGSIVNSRNRIHRIIKKNPGIQPKIPALYADLYQDALSGASAETGLPEGGFPSDNPWSLEQVLDRDLWPE